MFLALMPAVGRAQQPSARAAPAASIEVHLGVTRIAEVSSGSAGASATLHLSPRFRVGGGVWGALRRVDEGPVLEGSGLEMGVGYGGLFAEATLPGTPVYARLLVGAGAVTLRLQAVGTRFDVETFAVIEPALGATLPLPGPFSLGSLVGYRWVRGADDLFLAGDDDLGALSGSVFLRLGGL